MVYFALVVSKKIPDHSLCFLFILIDFRIPLKQMSVFKKFVFKTKVFLLLSFTCSVCVSLCVGKFFGLKNQEYEKNTIVNFLDCKMQYSVFVFADRAMKNISLCGMEFFILTSNHHLLQLAQKKMSSFPSKLNLRVSLIAQSTRSSKTLLRNLTSILIYQGLILSD